MSCANFQELLAGQGAATATDFTPANIDFPYDSDDDLRLDIYNYQDQAWVNVPLATGATIDVGGAGDRFYAWETYLTNGQTGVRTILATSGTTPALPTGGTASHPLAPANNVFPVESGAGVNVRLYRQTTIDAGELPAYFYPGASIRAEDLNDNFEALRKVVEEGSCSTNNVNDAFPQLNQRFWNKADLDDGGDTVTSGTAAAWPNNDDTIATTAAGDDRWLGIPGGGGTTLTAGAGIDLTGTTLSVDLEAAGAGEGGLVFDPSTGNNGEIRVNVNNGLELTANGVEIDLANPSGLEFSSGDLQVDANSGLTIDANGLNVGQGTGITVNADDVAVTSQTIWGRPHDHSAAVTGDMTNVGDIQFQSGGGTLDGVDGQNILIAAGGTGIFDVDRNTDINGTLDVSGNTDLGGTLEVAGNVTIESGNDLVFQDDDASNTVTVDVPNDVTTSYTVTLPPAGPGADNRILESDSNGDLSWIATPSGGGSSLTIQEEGTSLATAATILNFTGAGVTASGNTATKEINIPGGGDTYDLNASQDGTNVDLNLTSGSATDNSVVQLTAGAGVSLTVNSSSEVTIANTAGALNFQGTVDISDAATIPANAAIGDAFIQDSDVTSVHADWNAILDPDQSSANAGDIIAFSTARVSGGAAGVAALIPTGGNNTTYDLTATDNGDNADINLVPNDGSGTDTVTIAAGTNVTVDHSGSTITINSTATGTGGITVEEEGTALATAATTLNFTGTGVTASGTGAEKTINIPGASAGVTQVNTNDGLDGGPITGTGTIGIADNGVTFARMQDIDQNRIIGRVDASSGDPTALTAAQVRTMINVADGATDNAGTVTSVAGNNGLTGTVTASGNIGLAAIANNRVLGNSSGGNAVPTAVQVATNMIADDAVTYAKMQDVATANRVLGSTSAGGTVTEVQITQPMINASGNAANRVLAINSSNNGMVWVNPGSVANSISQNNSNVTVTDAGTGANQAGSITSVTDGTTRLTIPSGTNGLTTNNAVISAEGTAAFRVPVGTTAQRPGQADQPAAAAGQVRFNSSTNILEMFNGTIWDNAGAQPSVMADFVVIGGGGGGAGASGGGGGGAGGYRSSWGTASGTGNSGGGVSCENPIRVPLDEEIDIVVGTGGTANGGSAGNGGNSQFHSINCTGGGGGVMAGNQTTPGRDGGSGGGSGNGNGTGLGSPGGDGAASQGFDGGRGAHQSSDWAGGGGGGGAGAAGADCTLAPTRTAGNGGNGVSSSITGTAVTRAGGGGGGAHANGTGGTGGSGGGGNGQTLSQGNRTSGTANTGSGGGGGGNQSGAGGLGADGVVIFRTPNNVTATFSANVTANGSTGGQIAGNDVGTDHVWVVTAAPTGSTVTLSVT